MRTNARKLRQTLLYTLSPEAAALMVTGVMSAPIRLLGHINDMRDKIIRGG